MKMYRRLGLLAALVMMTSAAFAQMTLVSKGKAKAYIVLAEDNSVNREAADMLARFVNKISGAQLEIAPAKAKGGAIVIGEAAATPAEDGFELVCKNGALHIKTGGGKGAGFEGGQTPLAMRLPKLPGFRNPRRIEYTAVNVERFERKFEDGAVIDGAALKAARITKSEFEPVKVLGNGELTKKFTVKVDKVSASAQAKIEAAGGKVELPC